MEKLLKKDILNYIKDVKAYNRHLSDMYLHTLLKIDFNEVDYFIGDPYVSTKKHHVIIFAMTKNGERITYSTINKSNGWN